MRSSPVSNVSGSPQRHIPFFETDHGKLTRFVIGILLIAGAILARYLIKGSWAPLSFGVLGGLTLFSLFVDNLKGIYELPSHKQPSIVRRIKGAVQGFFEVEEVEGASDEDESVSEPPQVPPQAIARVSSVNQNADSFQPGQPPEPALRTLAPTAAIAVGESAGQLQSVSQPGEPGGEPSLLPSMSGASGATRRTGPRVLEVIPDNLLRLYPASAQALLLKERHSAMHDPTPSPSTGGSPHDSPHMGSGAGGKHLPQLSISSAKERKKSLDHRFQEALNGFSAPPIIKCLQEDPELILHECGETGERGSPLHVAINEGMGELWEEEDGKFTAVFAKLIGILKERGNIDITDGFGNTLLHLFADTSKLIPGNYDDTYKSAKLKSRRGFIVSLLVNAGAEVNAKNQAGQTPLHRAMLSPDNKRVVELLVTRGAQKNAVDEQGCTPFLTGLMEQVKRNKSGGGLDEKATPTEKTLLESLYYLKGQEVDLNLKLSDGYPNRAFAGKSAKEIMGSVAALSDLVVDAGGAHFSHQFRLEVIKMLSSSPGTPPSHVSIPSQSSQHAVLLPASAAVTAAAAAATAGPAADVKLPVNDNHF